MSPELLLLAAEEQKTLNAGEILLQISSVRLWHVNDETSEKQRLTSINSVHVKSYLSLAVAATHSSCWRTD